METTNLEKRSREILGHLYDVAGVGMCVTDDDRRFVAINREYCKTYGYEPAELLGKEFTIVLPPDHRAAAAKLHDEFLFDSQAEVSGEWRVLRKDGSLCTVLITAGRLQLNGSMYKVTTVYELNGRSIRSDPDGTRRTTLREVTHRVKNHLNSLQSMLSLQLEASQREQTVVQILSESINRIKSMSRIYERLQEDPEITSVGLQAYVKALSADILATGGRDESVAIDYDVEDLHLTVEQATSLGLIINELMTNSLKHALPVGTPGTISIAIRSTGAYIEARVSDSGPGVPSFRHESNPDNLGMQIVLAIVGQHRGEFRLESSGSSTFLVRLPRIV